jgi:hypothetical protein
MWFSSELCIRFKVFWKVLRSASLKMFCTGLLTFVREKVSAWVFYFFLNIKAFLKVDEFHAKSTIQFNPQV